MSVYLQDVPLSVAKNRFQEGLEKVDLWRILEEEEIPLDENAIGRVVAEPIWARLSSPHYHASAMDGFAIRAKETDGAMPTNPIDLRVGEEAEYVDTGDPLPDWANAVVPIENTEPLNEAGEITNEIRSPYAIRLRAALPPWRHVRPMGEDIVATQLVLPAGHVLRPVDLGAIAACGHCAIPVSRKPCVTVIPTGTELVKVGVEVKRGDIIEYNSIVLAAQVKQWGGDVQRYSPIKDDYQEILKHVQRAADESDLVLLNAGSSAGSEDFSADVVAELGELLVHGVAVRPGHPVILGLIKRSKKTRSGDEKWVPIIGIPGYPVSAALTGEVFVEPLLARWMGRPPHEPFEMSANLVRKINSPAGDDDHVRMVVGRVGEEVLAAPLSRGAGVITSLVQADGITVLPRGVQGLEAGSQVKVKLYRSSAEIERTIFAVGSHDMTLDILAQFLSMKSRRLVSTNVGSLGGLVALRRGEAHIAGSHLLDPETGVYNVSYLQQYLDQMPVSLITWVYREQGLIVTKGNPKGVGGLEDLVRDDIFYVNRQRGAGTRVLLDYQLSKLNINKDQIQGYDQEEYTHLAVAAAIASGRVDCGLGVAAAAKALDLDFIPLYHERYDLVIPDIYLNSELLAPIFDIIKEEKFRQMILDLPGYDISQIGNPVELL